MFHGLLTTWFRLSLEWGYIGVYEDVLLGGAGFQIDVGANSGKMLFPPCTEPSRISAGCAQIASSVGPS